MTANVGRTPNHRGAMNPFNRLFIFQSWLFVGCAAGGTYLAGDRNMAFVVLVLNTLLLTAVLAGSDREAS